MKLTIEKQNGRYEAYFDTKLGRLPVREWLKPKVDAYKVMGKPPTDGPRTTYLDLMILADIDHSQYYQYSHSNSGFTLGILKLIQVLGYEVTLTKVEK